MKLSSLLPTTLFGRLTIVLVSGMVIAQVLGAVLLLSEFRKNMESTVLDQLAGLSLLLIDACDRAGPQGCVAYVDSLRARGMSVRYRAAPTAAPPAPQGGVEGRLLGALAQRLPPGTGVQRIPLDEAALPGREGEPPPRPGGVRLVRGDYALDLNGLEGGYPLFPSALPTGVVLEMLLRLALVILCALVAARLATQPLARLASRLETLGPQQASLQLAQEGPREVRLLAARINGMRRRLLAYSQQQTALLAGLSHDFRTPLTRLRLRLELMDDSPAGRRCIDDVTELQQMVQHTLELVQSGDTQVSLEPTPIGPLIQGLLQDLGVQPEIDIAPGQPEASALAQPLALKRALVNVIENAMRYAQRARIHWTSDTQFTTIVVRDEGPGVPEDMTESLLAPFVRVDPSRSRELGGAGLGLAIAKALVNAQGGEMWLTNRHEPRGLEVCIRLALAAVPPEAASAERG